MFITNQTSTGGGSVGERITTLLKSSKQLDMLVGFFYFSAIKLIAEPLQEKKELKLRVLVGLEAEKFGGQIVELATSLEGKKLSAQDVQERFLESVRNAVGAASLDTQAFHERIRLFIELLKENRLEIRKTLRPNHAKLYIFHMDKAHEDLCKARWITGSSNFSLPGLKMQDELNVEISDFGCEEACDYYEQLWAEAIPLTEQEEDRRILIQILEGESVGAIIDPYEAYFLILKHYIEYQQMTLDEARLEKVIADAGFSKLTYQTDAVRQALMRLEAHRGVIIGDVVGLGKSVIAGVLAAMRQKRGMIICPPGLMGGQDGESGGWNEYKRRFGLDNWLVCSCGMMEENLRIANNNPNIEMVIVDEAHRFRNDATEDYERLSLLCSGKEVVLLSATPFNNRPNDLYALLRLYSPANHSPFVIGGNLEGAFKSFTIRHEALRDATKTLRKGTPDAIVKALTACHIDRLEYKDTTDIKTIQKLLQKRRQCLAKDIRQIMERTIIRRNRIDLKKDPVYSKEITTLSEVQPPKEQYFTLSEEQNRFYDAIIKTYFGGEKRFKGAIYRPHKYIKNAKKGDDYQEHIYDLTLRILALRFESSFGAFRQSLVNMKKLLEKIQEFVKKFDCYVYSRDVMDFVSKIRDDDEAQDVLLQKIQELEDAWRNGNRNVSRHAPVYHMDDQKYNGAEFLGDLQSDIDLIATLIKDVDSLKLKTDDPKASALIDSIKKVLDRTHDAILPEKTSPKRKVLIFTAYSDTLEHLKPLLDKAFPKRVLTVRGAIGKDAQKVVREEFDASSSEQSDKYDILLTTDKMSEGYNLNRAGVVINYDIPWNPTRVIQRVGRINRIGKKVFDNLYIFNFFPTLKGLSINDNRGVAESKMLTIHNLLGEDAQIFSEDEEPTAAQLFERIQTAGSDEDEVSFYLQAKRQYEKMKASFNEEKLERIARFPNRVKCAFEKQPHGVFSFRRQGAGFFAVVKLNGQETCEWALEDAIPAIQCNPATKRCSFSEDFWKKAEDGGTYQSVCDFEPTLPPTKKKQPINFSIQAINNLQKAFSVLSSRQLAFAKMLVRDIQSFRTLPKNLIKTLAGYEGKEHHEELKAKIEELIRTKGEFYLKTYEKNLAAESIVVTIETV